MSKSNWGTSFAKNLIGNGWVKVGDELVRKDRLTSEQKETLRAIASEKKKKRLQVIKTGWINDTRNIKNKEATKDKFMKLIEKEFSLEVWPEFFFSTERLYRLDYAIAVDRDGKEIKIGIEVQGGIWAKGNSGHSSGKGITRDMDKSNLLQSSGWRLIQVTPAQLLTNYTLDLIRKMI